MSRFGFRLYAITLHRGAARTRSKWGTEEFEYLQHLKRVAKRLHQDADSSGQLPPPWRLDHGLMDIKDLPDELLGDAPTDAVVGRLLSLKGSASAKIEVTVGKVGTHESALGRGDDLSLTGRAPAHPFRALLVPGHGDEEGLLAVESVGRFCPVGQIQRLLGLGSRLLAQDQGADTAWWWIKCEQASDEEFLEKVLTGNKAELTLQRFADDGSGRKRPKDLILKGAIKERAGALQEWLGVGEPGARAMRVKTGVPAMLKLIGEEGTLGDVGFDDGFVTIGDGENRTTIHPGQSMSDVFTYPVGDVRPTRDAWFKQARDRMRVLRPEILQ